MIKTPNRPARIRTYRHIQYNGNINVKKNSEDDVSYNISRAVASIRSRICPFRVHTTAAHGFWRVPYVRRLNARTYEYDINRFRVVRLVKNGGIKKKIKNKTGRSRATRRVCCRAQYFSLSKMT